MCRRSMSCIRGGLSDGDEREAAGRDAEEGSVELGLVQLQRRVAAGLAGELHQTSAL